MATIIETARTAGSFGTLVTAIEGAGLAGTLNGPGPFTVFAPTNEAFARLPAGAMDRLLADTSTLAKILTYHVATGKLSAADLTGVTRLTTVEGSDLQIDASGDATRIDGATVVQPDLAADNGVIHAIDTLLVPLDDLGAAHAAYSYLIAQ